MHLCGVNRLLSVCVCVVEYAASQWCVSAVCCGAVDLLCLQCSVIPNYPLHQLCSTRLLFGIQTTAPGLSLHPPLPCVSREIISHILSPYPFVSLYIPFPFLRFCFHTRPLICDSLSCPARLSCHGPVRGIVVLWEICGKEVDFGAP